MGSVDSMGAGARNGRRGCSLGSWNSENVRADADGYQNQDNSAGNMVEHKNA